MAIDYSDDYLALQYDSPRLLLLKAVINLFPAIEFARRQQRRFLKAPGIDLAHLPECLITESLEASAENFRERGWAFIENVFEPDFHQFLVTHWPRRRYFTAPFDVHKAYDKGFRWVKHNPARDRWGELMADDAKSSDHLQYPAYVNDHPHLKRLIDYFRCDSFIKRVEALSARPEPLVFNRFQLTTSYPGTLVAPHKDTPQAGKNWVALLFYIAGTGGENSGGTAIINDNQFKDVIFEPKQLTNTCLAFNPFAQFYHGVRPMALGKYRWMLSAEYVSDPNA